MAPRVTVLMPTHNRADVIGVAIQSVLQQTEADFELLVVADGCTDDTARVVRGVADRRVRLFNLPKAPYFGYANRNVALREARGEFVAFAAHDDLLFPDHLAVLLEALESSGHQWGYSRPLWVSTDGVIVPSGTNLTLPDELDVFLTEANTIPASCVVYRRSCLDRYGYWPEDVASAADWVHWTKIVEGGGRALTYVEQPTCLHFSANWRGSRHADRPEVHTALQVADASAWWPPALRYHVPTGMPEQQVIAEAMSAGGAAWAQAVRQAVRTTLDRLAWDDVRDIRPRLAAEEAGRMAALSRAGQAEAATSATRHELERAQEAAEVQRIASDRQRAQVEAERDEARAQLAGLETACATLLADVARRDAAGARDRATAASLSRVLDETRRALDQSNEAAREARSRQQDSDAHLTAVQASTSWRLTRPLRAIKSVWQRRQKPSVG